MGQDFVKRLPFIFYVVFFGKVADCYVNGLQVSTGNVGRVRDGDGDAMGDK